MNGPPSGSNAGKASGAAVGGLGSSETADARTRENLNPKTQI
jgi:hypothetical protein